MSILYIFSFYSIITDCYSGFFNFFRHSFTYHAMIALFIAIKTDWSMVLLQGRTSASFRQNETVVLKNKTATNSISETVAIR